MSTVELLILSVGLSMDAFAVAACKGLSMTKLSWRNALTVALWFGVFQAAMPVLGYFLGYWFDDVIHDFDHWVAFILLAFIGINMIRESRYHNQEISDAIDVKTMFVLAVATSIDALAIGVTFAFLEVRLAPAVITIGVTTTLLSLLGVKLGNVFGARYKSKAELAGGIILILIGLNILCEHLLQ